MADDESPLPHDGYLGRPTRRVDGALKVTGAAKYAGEYGAEGLLQGAVVSSAIAKGCILSIDAGAALALPGVVQVFTHENRPRYSHKDSDHQDQVGPPGSPFEPLADERVVYSHQPVALVVAETFEAARDAAGLVKISYAPEEHITELDAVRGQSYEPPKRREGIQPPPKPRGDFATAMAAAPVKLSHEYRVGVEHHNPMEPFATTCVWKGGGEVVIYDKTQGSQNAQQYVVGVFGLKKNKVQVVNSFVGGAFGIGLRPQHQLFLAVMAAKALERSVRVTLTRDQMFSLAYRPETVQIIRLGAREDGKLTAIRHHATGVTSAYEDHQEVVVNWSTLLYDAPNTDLTYELTKIDTQTPTDMRAPGAVIGVFAVESAMDELSYQLGMDPIALRLKNYAERDQDQNKEFSSKSLRACFARGAESFGWRDRKPEPRSMRDGQELVGWGMASGVWESKISKTQAEASFSKDGHLTVSSATSDCGQGTYTIMTQTAADALGLPLDSVTAKLGDSMLPTAPVEGGSWAAASTCSAIEAACEKLKAELVSAAHHLPGKPIGGAKPDEVVFRDGRIVRRDDGTRSVSLLEVMQASGKTELKGAGKAAPDMLAARKYVGYTHSAIFCEVKVDEELGAVRVTRIVIAVGAGRILNPKTARSQIIGGVVMALGSALEEETFLDHKLGRFMNHNLAEYHVPVNADIGGIEVIFVEEQDAHASPIGAKGLGEIGIVGTGAAIANAIFHATGRRVRRLPITIDKVLGLAPSSENAR